MSRRNGLRVNLMVRLFKKVSEGRPIHRVILTLIAPLFFFGLLSILICAAVKVDGWLEFGELIPGPWNIRLSRLFMLGGLGLMGWSASCFFRAHGTPVPFNPPRRLVTTGPYAWARNPMMTGLFCVLLGIGIRLQSYSLLFVFLPMFIVLISLQLRNVEEPGLEMRFGEEYLHYKNRTPRFFPRIKMSGRKQ